MDNISNSIKIFKMECKWYKKYYILVVRFGFLEAGRFGFESWLGLFMITWPQSIFLGTEFPFFAIWWWNNSTYPIGCFEDYEREWFLKCIQQLIKLFCKLPFDDYFKRFLLLYNTSQVTWFIWISQLFQFYKFLILLMNLLKLMSFISFCSL